MAVCILYRKDLLSHPIKSVLSDHELNMCKNMIGQLHCMIC